MTIAQHLHYTCLGKGATNKERQVKFPYMIISIQSIVIGIHPIFYGSTASNPTAGDKRLQCRAIGHLGAQGATLSLLGYHYLGAHLEWRQNSNRTSLHNIRKRWWQIFSWFAGNINQNFLADHKRYLHQHKDIGIRASIYRTNKSINKGTYLYVLTYKI